ncbi:TPA: MarR family transcriptional regulator, partial [Escherichia coli]
TLSMVLNDYRINEAMFMMMIILSNQNGNSVSPSDISHILDCTRTNVTRITDALEKKDIYNASTATMTAGLYIFS